MKLSFVVVAAALAGIVCLSFASKQEGMPPTAKPGKQHELLAKKAGTWDALITMGGQPGGKAVFTAKMDHGGLWLVGDFRGEFMGAPFSGHEITGYDSKKQKFVSTWIDSMIDRVMVFEGDYDEKSKTLSLWTEGTDPMTGKPMRERHDHEFIDADNWEFTMNHPAPDGSFAPVLTITYKRKK